MTLPTLPTVQPLGSGPGDGDCWNRIGVWGDRSCPELVAAVHCHNCPVFANVSRHFLDAPAPPGYLEEWTQRLIAPVEKPAGELESVLVFRFREEWLALRIQVLQEVTGLKPVHRVPHRAGLLAGLVNIRGELHLTIHLAQLLGFKSEGAKDNGQSSNGTATSPLQGRPRMVVVQSEGERWVFAVDEVDRVQRVSTAELSPPPATLARAAGRLTRAVFHCEERSIGLLDDARLFQILRARGQ